MAKLCLNCSNIVPKFFYIGSKRISGQRRKYCLDCSPFGKHNTRKLEKPSADGSTKQCPDCNDWHTQRGNRCFRCYFNKRKVEVSQRVAAIVGAACWICGYAKTKRNLCFHHTNAATKKFNLTTRELMLKWDRVFTEMKKCVLVCCNCHGEIHDHLILDSVVQDIWKSRWLEILA